MTTTVELRSAVLDSEHIGDIRGALGTIRLDDTAPRRGRSAALKTLLAIIGPGLIVMVGDNDAGAFATYGQAGQNYGTRLVWTLLLLVPVLYVNQEMVVRLGAVTGVGHARLILERFGKFWGAFSVIDLFILNALTIITEFIGITLAAGYLGLPKLAAVALAAAVIVGAAFTGSFRRFERIAVAFCAGSLLLIPVYFFAHPGVSQMARNFVIPQLPGGAGQLSTVMLLIIGIVGTTVAPWQLFFQQSYVIDKRITPRFMKYEKADLCIGIVIVVVGGAALMGACAAAFAHTGGFGHFTDAAGLAAGLQAYGGRTVGVLFAIALLDASIIGAFAVSLSTAYAISDVFGLKHSLHRGVRGAKGFYAIYGAPDWPGRRRRADPGLAARPADRRRPGPGRRAASVGHRLPAAAVQRPRGARSVGQRPQDQHVHRGGRRDPGHAVGHPDCLGAVPGYQRAADHRHRGVLRCRRGAGCWLRTRPAAVRRPQRRAGRAERPGELADAAAGPAAAAGDVRRAQDRNVRPAPVPGRCDGPRHHQDRSARDRSLTVADTGAAQS